LARAIAANPLPWMQLAPNANTQHANANKNFIKKWLFSFYLFFSLPSFSIHCLSVILVD